MFDLNKIIDIIKESGKEIFLAKENEDPFVIMTLSRYRELRREANLVNKESFVNIKDISPSTDFYPESQMVEPSEENYPMHVRKTIMPETE